jgi:phenylalanyl-tRNA synthetase beta chain
MMAQDMLMICDGEKPVGIAGVMGGMNSEIEPGTKPVFFSKAPVLTPSVSARLPSG